MELHTGHALQTGYLKMMEDGTARVGRDYAAVDPFTVTIPAGEVRFTLRVIEDAEIEAEETIERAV